jgi:hypothetical protein
VLDVINADGTEWKRIALKVLPDKGPLAVSRGREQQRCATRGKHQGPRKAPSLLLPLLTGLTRWHVDEVDRL